MSEISKGIDKVFVIFPLKMETQSTVEYISYKLEKPKFDVIECKQRSLSYLYARSNVSLLYMILIQKIIQTNFPLKNKKFLRTLLMTPSATFITNGVERVVAIKCIEAQVSSLIMTKGKPTQVETFI